MRVCEIKDEEKAQTKATPKVVGAVFDLQQVMYLPKSYRSEVFISDPFPTSIYYLRISNKERTMLFV